MCKHTPLFFLSSLSCVALWLPSGPLASTQHLCTESQIEILQETHDESRMSIFFTFGAQGALALQSISDEAGRHAVANVQLKRFMLWTSNDDF
jgi:hypothetical protein